MPSSALAIAVAAFLLSWGATPAFGAGPHTGEEYLKRLVAALGDDDHAVREEASSRLREYEPALPLLEAAARAKDPEVRRRAAAALRHLVGFLAARGIGRVVPLAGDGRIDLLPEAALAWGRNDQQGRLFQAAAFLAERAAARARPWQRLPFPMTAYPKFPIPARGIPGLLRAGGHARSFGDKVELKDLYDHFVIAGTMDVTGGTGRSMLIVGGDSVGRGLGAISISSSILIANGDVELLSDQHVALVICDGKVTLKGQCITSVIIARKGIDARKAGIDETCVLASCGPVDCGHPLGHIRVESKARRPLGIIRFFEVSDVGLALDGLAVKSASPRLSRAGLREGDVFAAIDGVAVKDAEALRRALRKQYALGGVAEIAVRRAGKPATVRARLAEE